MPVNEAERDEHIQVTKDWIKIGIFLLVPVLRFFGIYMLLKKLRKTVGGTKKQNTFWYIIAALLIYGSLDEIVSGVTSMIIPMSVAVLAVLGVMIFMQKSKDKLENYQACIGNRASISLDELMSAMGVTETRLRRDVSTMKKKGMLPKSCYIDEGCRMLVMRDEGRPASRPHAQTTSTPNFAEEEPLNELERRNREIILEIRTLNIAIDDEKVSERIDRIEEITANIFHLVEQHPEREKDIQSFMEYYLPTTLKLLRQYAQLEHQSVKGENITAAKTRIEAILDKLVGGFEKQLDVLFKSEAMDITNDVRVLEKMMQMDGLSR